MRTLGRSSRRTVVLTYVLATLSLAAQCAPRALETSESGPTLSEFASRLLPHQQAPIPSLASGQRAGSLRRGVWSMHPGPSGCSTALMALARLEDEETGLHCRGFHSCLSTIIEGLQTAGIRRGSAQLIRIDAVAAPSSQRRMNGLRLRFEEHVDGAAEEQETYTANILILPDDAATVAATLITRDRGESYECFDAANLAFAQFTEGLGG